MLLLFAHGLTVARGGARDCVAAFPDTEQGLVEAIGRAERDWHDSGAPSGYEWCALYRALPGCSLELVAVRRPGLRWETREGEPFAEVEVRASRASTSDLGVGSGASG